jgi:hypothetical protein
MARWTQPYTGAFSKDRNSLAGGWRFNPGGDERVNVPYESRG